MHVKFPLEFVVVVMRVHKKFYTYLFLLAILPSPPPFPVLCYNAYYNIYFLVSLPLTASLPLSLCVLFEQTKQKPDTS